MSWPAMSSGRPFSDERLSRLRPDKATNTNNPVGSMAAPGDDREAESQPQ
jgi:hypothetical protein